MDFTSRSIRLMGTTIRISVLHAQADTLLEQVVQLLQLYENRFSANYETSELMQINHSAGIREVQVHSDLFELIQLGKLHSLADKSHLNITIGPLVQTWRIGFSDARLPSPVEIQQALALTDPNLIQLNPEKQSVFFGLSRNENRSGSLGQGLYCG